MTLHHLLSAHWLAQKVGIFGLFGIIFAETGLLVGFFLPGDSLLVTAGVLASPGRHFAPANLHWPLGWVLIGTFIAAVAGAQVGYVIGRSAGPALFNRPESRLFKPEHVRKAHAYFEKYGDWTVVLARFVPIVRTFANPVAGVSRMNARAFAVYNLVGAVVWVGLVTLLGYWIGDSVKDTYLIPAVVGVSLIPLGVAAIGHRRAAKARAAGD